MAGETKYVALVVDDTDFIRKIVQTMLNTHGFETKTAENGEEAVRMFNAGNSFDVVLMDMEMPIMDGIQATKEIRALGVKSLIFGLTACDRKTDIEAFMEAGLNECFNKPLTIVMIDKILKQLNK